MFLAKIAEGQAIVDKFAQVREARNQLDKKVENGSTPEAVQYRDTLARANTKLTQIKEDEKYNDQRAQIATLEAQIKVIKDEVDADIKARSGKIRELVAKAKEAAQIAEVGQVVTDVDPQQLAKDLTDVNTIITGFRNLLLPENEGLKGWRVLAHGSVTGNAAGEKPWNPRLHSAKVNGNPVAPAKGKEFPTLENVASVIGVDKGHLSTNLQNKGTGGVRVLSQDKETTFTFDHNGTPVEVTVLGRGNAKDTETEEAEAA
jgi:hypothetical protein